MNTQPHHDGSVLYVDDPAPGLGDIVGVRLRIPAGFGPVEGVWLRSVRDAEPHYDAAVRLGAHPASAAGHPGADGREPGPGVVPSVPEDGWEWWQAPLTIVNPVQNYRWLVRSEGRNHWINAAGHSTRDVPDVRDFRIGTHGAPAEWVRRSVMYQVFPDRFARSEQADAHPVPEWALACDWNTTPVIGQGPQTPYQFYGGDLTGLRSKLDHIEALGATVVYLTPMFPARSNHRYDASDFSGVDPLLGGDAEFVKLIREIHARGLKVIGDLTTNHSGDAHEWFRNSHRNPGAPESEYYYYGEGNEDYVAWLGVDSLPKFNWNSEGLRRRFVLDDDSMAARWLKPPFNLDGWRIDVGNMTGRMGADDLNHEVAALLRARIHEIKPDAMLLAESTSDASADFQGDTWQGAMTYTNFTRPLWQWLASGEAPEGSDGVRRPWYFGLPQAGPDRIEAEDFLATHLDFAAGFPWTVRQCNMNAIDTHDTARAASAMVPGGQGVGVFLQFTLPGIPMVFMGDEFGLKGFNGEDSRTPMPWDDPARVLEDLRPLYADLAGLRSGHPALVDGGIRWVHAEGDVLAFVREHAGGSVLVVAARAPFSGVELPLGLVGRPAGVDPAGPDAAALAPLVHVGGGIHAAVRGDVLVLEGSGPAAAAYALDGIQAPAP
ncbi:glycoside hydrolase family 13 protein [Zafaria sp. J156]|uniref:glycoside hydrolase family 13 protein n=1 Tax=Zafaria sp. J156 TaxID=3116490 RepID=UPI002E75FB3E|nr:glycoside hydrolase family 13 protein [Zafaria sp. J156]MEE1622423.1 glycoside hydrolase family 13 protein [Zafaria sp. J156]